MVDRRDDAALASALRSLAPQLAFPPTPDLASTVGSRIATVPGAATGARPAWLRRPLVRSLALAIAALLLIAGAAVAIGIAIGGLRITFSSGTPPPLPSGVAAERAFGNEVGLAAARARAGFPLRLPTIAALGAPDHVYYNDFPSGGTVALVWGARDGHPADPRTGVGVVVTEFRADVEPAAWEKMVYGDTTVEQVTVNGGRGYWISGGPHGLAYRDASGHRIETTLRLVGASLVWLQDGLVLRVEGAQSLAAAQEVAGSLR